MRIKILSAAEKDLEEGHQFYESQADGLGTYFLDTLVRERRLNMKKLSTNKDDQEVPELKREQLGAGVRGKYHKQFMQGSNVVILQPEIQKAFPTSEAVNKALASMLAFTQEAQIITHAKRTPRKRVAV